MNKDKHIFSSISVEKSLFDFINNEVCIGLNITAEGFFKSLSETLNELQKENIHLLKKRDNLQSQIDKWHTENKRIDPESYKPS